MAGIEQGQQPGTAQDYRDAAGRKPPLEPVFRTAANPDAAANTPSPEAQADAMVRRALTASNLDLEPDIQNEITGYVADHLREMRANYTDQGLMGEDPDALAHVGLQPTAEMQTLAAQLAGALDGSGKDKKDKNAFFHHIMMDNIRHQIAALDHRIAAIDNRLEVIDQRLGAIDRKLGGIRDSLSAVDQLEQLQKAGKLDPDNPTHRALMRRAGVSPDDIKTDPGAALNNARRKLENEQSGLSDEQRKLLEKQNILRGERNSLQKERNGLADQYDRLQRQSQTVNQQLDDATLTVTALSQRVEGYSNHLATVSEEMDRLEAEGTPAALARRAELQQEVVKISQLQEETMEEKVRAERQQETLVAQQEELQEERVDHRTKLQEQYLRQKAIDSELPEGGTELKGQISKNESDTGNEEEIASFLDALSMDSETENIASADKATEDLSADKTPQRESTIAPSGPSPA